MKYKLGEKHPSQNLYRVVALKDFSNVKEGEVGGLVEGEHNLSQDGNAWVYGDARVYGKARVSGNARVYEDAWVYGDACVYENAWVSGTAEVSGNARVFGNARVYGDARVSGNAWVFGDASPKREWVGLKNDEVNEFASGCHLGISVQDAIRKAEAKLKEKNT